MDLYNTETDNIAKCSYFSISKIRDIRQLHETESVMRTLRNIELQEEPYQFKIGVIYVREGQTHEDEIFSNKTGSEGYDEFLSIIGNKIALKNWTGFTGGLDVTGATGEYSYYTNYSGYEIMYHISTELPYSDDDTQQLERKRHLGNDIVIIVYLDRNYNSITTNISQYSPETIVSQFNHVVLVVSPTERDANGELNFFVQCARKQGVPAFGPSIPKPPFYVKRNQLREYLLCKAINAECAAYEAATFKNKLKRTREGLLTSLV